MYEPSERSAVNKKRASADTPERASTEALAVMKKASDFDPYPVISRISGMDRKTYGVTHYEGLQRMNIGFFDLYPDIFASLTDRFEKYKGQATISARKLCLQSRMQRRHRALYLRLPSPSKKKLHSSFHFWLLLINHAHFSSPCGAQTSPALARSSQL